MAAKGGGMLEDLRSRIAQAISPTMKATGQTQDIDALYKMLLQRSPPARTTSELIAAFKRVPEFRAVVSKIADHVASVNWRLYVVRGKSGKARKTRIGWMADGECRRKELARYKRTGELEEILDHPMAKLLDQANPTMSGFAARRLEQIYLDVVGESYSIVTRGALDVPTALWPMPPSWVTPPENNNEYFEVKISGRVLKVPPEDMLWTRDADPLKPYGRGTGIGEALGDELDISDFGAKYVKAFFYNSGRPDMIIGLEGSNKDQAARIQEAYEEKHRGHLRAHRPWFTSGKLSVKDLNAKFADMQVVELKGAVRDTFVNTFGIPPEVLGILTNSNRSTIREALRMFAIETIVPRLERHRDERQRFLVPMFDDRIVLDYDDPVPVDPEDQLKAMQSAPWAATRGEWREVQGLEHRGDVDEVHGMPIALSLRRANDSAEPVGLPAQQPSADVDPEKSVGIAKSDVDRVDNVLESLMPERLTQEVDPVWQSNMQDWGDEVLADLGLSQSFDMLNPLVTDHLRDFSTKRIKGLVDGTTRDALRAELIEGVRAGEDIKSLSGRVRSVFSAAQGYRSERIARTEVLGSSNFGTWSAHKQSGIAHMRQWVSTPDGNTRDEHLEVKGPVGIDEPFDVGGEALFYPGDSNGSGWNVINCRCTTTPVIDEPKSADQLDAEWKVYDRRLIPWERSALEALQRGFKAQQTAVLDALRREFGSNGHALHIEHDDAPHGVAFI